MKNIIVISFLLNTIVTFSQHKKEDLAVVKITKEFVSKQESIDPVFVSPNLDLKTSIENGFKTGNAKLIAFYFSKNIDISLLDKENLYSKSQGEQVLKTFFMDNKPVSFVFGNEGKSASIKYFIGTLTTKTSSFRITVNVKTTSEIEVISHLTIEKED
jgi:hypothetical protein